MISRAVLLNKVHLRTLMSSKKSSKKPLNTTTTIPILTGPIKFRTDKEGFVQLNLHVKPGAKISRVAEITENHIGLQVKNRTGFFSSYYHFRYQHHQEMVKLTKK